MHTFLILSIGTTCHVGSLPSCKIILRYLCFINTKKQIFKFPLVIFAFREFHEKIILLFNYVKKKKILVILLGSCGAIICTKTELT